MILYTGPSLLDGRPIVAIATAGTSNAKTGDMVQTWILRADMDPLEASASEADSSVCGQCPHRRSLGGSCYVTLHQAPRAVWYAWWRGSYSTPEAGRRVRRAIANGAGVRLGAYGDPAAVPVEVWRSLLEGAPAHTGYTHQWRNPVAAPLRTLVMASCDSDEDCRDAAAAGWRYFRVKVPGEAPPAGSVECLSDARGVTCRDCGICNGARPNRDRQPTNVWIDVHGSLSSRFQGRRSPTLTVLR